MAREKKSMIGFDPLSWLDDEKGGNRDSSGSDNEMGAGISATAEDACASDCVSEQAVSAPVDDEGVPLTAKKKSAAKKKPTGKKMITVLGCSLDETALLKGYKLAVDILDDVVIDFYESLFRQYPAVKPLFENISDQAQAEKLSAALKFLVEYLHDEKTLKITLSQMGERHQGYGALPEHYPVVAELLVASLKNRAGRCWTKPVNAAWMKLLLAAAQTMCAAYQELAVDPTKGAVIDIKQKQVGDMQGIPPDSTPDIEGESYRPALQLQVVQDISKSLALKSEMLALVNDHDEIAIQASEVKRIDGSALQLLCVLFNYAEHNNLIIHWIKPTDELIQSAQALGMQKILELH